MTRLALLLTSRAILAAAENETPLAKVLELLDDLKKEITQEGKDQTKQYNTFVQWCQTTQEETENIIDTGKSKIADLASFIKQQMALQDKLRSEVEQLSAEIASNERELQEDTNQRKGEHQVFLQDETAFVKALDELNLSIEVMEKKVGSGGGSFAQQGAVGGGKTPSMVKIAETVRHVLEKNVELTSTQQQTLDSFFQDTLNRQELPQPMSFLQVSGMDQAPAQAMNSLIQTLKTVRENTEKKRQNAQLEEERQANAFKLLEQDLKNQISVGQQSMSTKKSDIARSEQVQAENQAELDDTQRSVVQSEQYMETVQQQCQEKAQARKESVKTRSDELTAIQEAIVILSSDAGKAADQVSTYGANMMQVDGSDQGDPMMSFVQTEGSKKDRIAAALKKGHSKVLSLLATRVQSTFTFGLSESSSGKDDPFDKVKTMIEGMIERLMEEQAQNAEHKEWCDKETAKSTKQKNQKDRLITEGSNRVEELEAQITQLRDELTQLTKELADMERNAQEATTQRQAEKKQALVTIKSQQDAQMLVQNAIQVLKSFYDKQSQSLAQVDAMSTDAPDVEMTKSKTGAAEGIIGILEIALNDFSKLEQETTQQEQVSAAEYKKLMQETQVQKAVNKKTVEFKQEQKQKLEGELLSTKNDVASFKEGLEAVTEYLAKLKDNCEFKTPSYEQRKARREQEIKSLQEALSIINGDGVPGGDEEE
mmetsp:Transcript_10750/g.25671  ORF Transcript_10750/g.25671 Transcript_10750/m.25671 type:complete len:711 (-) Transcript_10750:85-2217(-)